MNFNKLSRFLTTTLLLIVLHGATVSAQEADWPQWRGPNRDGVSREKGLLKQWPSGGPRRVWLFEDAGLGYGGPAVVGDRLYILGARDDIELLLAINAQTGKEQWSVEIGRIYENGWGDGPRGTPTVDGDFVYALGARGTLICARASSGEVMWRQRMQDLGGRVPGWGYCESVLIDGEKVVCTPGGGKGAIAALNKTTGELVWQSSQFTDGAQYASILPIQNAGRRQYVQLTMRHVAGVDAGTGELLWQVDFPGSTAVVPTPISKGGLVYVTAGYGAGCKLVQIDRSQQARQVYANRVMKNQHGGVVLVGDNLYGYSDGAGWVCQNFRTGKRLWNHRRFGKGSLTYAEGMLYCLTESGDAALVDASPQGWKERGRFQLSPQSDQRSPSGAVWTHPVVAGGKLYLRDQEMLLAFDVKRR